MIRLKGWTSDMHHTRAARLDGDATVLHASACVAECDRDYRRAMLHRTMAHAKQMQSRWHERRAGNASSRCGDAIITARTGGCSGGAGGAGKFIIYPMQVPPNADIGQSDTR